MHRCLHHHRSRFGVGDCRPLMVIGRCGLDGGSLSLFSQKVRKRLDH